MSTKQKLYFARLRAAHAMPDDEYYEWETALSALSPFGDAFVGGIIHNVAASAWLDGASVKQLGDE